MSEKETIDLTTLMAWDKSPGRALASAATAALFRLGDIVINAPDEELKEQVREIQRKLDAAILEYYIGVHYEWVAAGRPAAK